MRKKPGRTIYIKRLVRFGGILTDQDIGDVLLVQGGFKPAAMVELSYPPHVKFSKRKFLKKINDLKQIFRKLDLIYRLYINYPKNSREVTRYSYIARNEKTLKKLIAADAEKVIRKRRLETGALLGYPRTAVETFANGKSLSLEKLPKTALENTEFRFLNFRLSKHWRKEFIYAKRRASAIKNMSPELYNRILNKNRRAV